MSSSPSAFPTTQWALIDRVRFGDDDALEALCRAYWFPLYSFARLSGLEAPDAEDAVQDFFLVALKQDLLGRADEQIGKLRNLLCIAFKRHLGHRRRQEQTLRRGGLVEHLPLLPDDAEERYQEAAAHSADSPDQAFHRQWARNVIERAQNALRIGYEAEGKAALFDRLAAFLPLNADGDGDGETEPEPLGDPEQDLIISANYFRQARHRMRKRLRDCIRSEVRETTQSTDPAVIDEEIRDLLQVLTAA